MGWSEEVGLGRALALHDGRGLALVPEHFLPSCWTVLNRLVDSPTTSTMHVRPVFRLAGRRDGVQARGVENVYGRIGQMRVLLQGPLRVRMPTTTKTVNCWTGKAGIGTDLRA